jgi:pentafunctional AROM polypeptide
VRLHVRSAVSQPYIDLTIRVMEQFGVPVKRTQAPADSAVVCYEVPPGVYRPPSTAASTTITTSPASETAYVIEADASSASYALSFAAATGRSVMLRNLGTVSMQADAKFAHVRLFSCVTLVFFG